MYKSTCQTLFIILFCVINCCLHFSDGGGADLHRLKFDPEEKFLYDRFYNFAVKHGRTYLNDSLELVSRFQIFKESVQRAEILNAPYKKQGLPPVFGVNKFSDLTQEEFKAKYLSGLKQQSSPLKFQSRFSLLEENRMSVKVFPQLVDWRKKPVLSPIKDQGSCGACWAFSLTETMESMSVIQYNVTSVPKLSPQELIDCNDGGNGCEGGDICQAAEWATNHGIVAESLYPITRHTDACKQVSPSSKRVKITDFYCQNFTNKEMGILKAVANHGPVTVAVDAATWHNYVGGIIRFHCSRHTNHAVQIVGYNLNGDVPYYILRNSWGSDFGDHGYLYVKFGDNLCGVATRVVKLNVSPQV
ncbi:cathepsin o [Plakobranchus ocellatus]|uniref:Cathepsin o n=1 Tax=Plakobranchus ocellatus TaxID=259542 RepID=A0AAV4BDW8_9GAST|nr:cathepsin o [Plakobranchus ocellatus]